MKDDIDITVTEIEKEDQPPTYASTAAHSKNTSDPHKQKHIEERIDVNEEILLNKKSIRPWRTMLTGMPDPVSTLLSLLTFLINVTLVLATVDFVYSAKMFHPSHDLSFARMGYM